MSPNASHRVRPGLSSAASLITTLLISFDQEALNQHLNLDLNLVTPEYPFFESPCPLTRIGVRPWVRCGAAEAQARARPRRPPPRQSWSGCSRRPRGGLEAPMGRAARSAVSEPPP